MTPSRQNRLIERALAGDHEAFRVLTAPWIPELRRRCARIVGDSSDADDAIQETLINAWRKLGSYNASGPLRAWLHAIATNSSLNLLKARARSIGATDGEPLAEAASDDDLREEIGVAFAAAVAGLPPRQRAVLVLRDGVGLAPGEIATVLGVTKAAVNSALQRARAGVARDASDDGLDALHAALAAGYLAAWRVTDVERLIAFARSDALRTALIEHLRPVGGGWVAIPSPGRPDTAPEFRPAFMTPG